MDIINIFWFIIGAITSALPAPLVKYYLKTDRSIWIIISIISYVTLIFVYTVILKDRNVTITYAILKVLSIIFTAGLDIFIFKTKFSLKTIIGIVLAIVSVILLSIKDID
jgi:multidrug transporter EmrE-like cation transporter